MNSYQRPTISSSLKGVSKLKPKCMFKSRLNFNNVIDNKNVFTPARVQLKRHLDGKKDIGSNGEVKTLPQLVKLIKSGSKTITKRVNNYNNVKSNGAANNLKNLYDSTQLKTVQRLRDVTFTLDPKTFNISGVEELDHINPLKIVEIADETIIQPLICASPKPQYNEFIPDTTSSQQNLEINPKILSLTSNTTTTNSSKTQELVHLNTATETEDETLSQNSKSEDENKQLFYCSLNNCKKVYPYKHHLERHIATIHNGQKFICPICEALLASKTYLNTHMRIHNLGTHYHCMTCNLVFKRRDVYNKHRTYIQCGGKVSRIKLTEENRQNYTIVNRGDRKQIRKMLTHMRIGQPSSQTIGK